MRQGFLFSIMLLGVVCGTVWAVGGDMGGGDPNGSPEKPYLIEDLADFDEFAGNSAYWASGVHTKLMTNIDLSGRTYSTAVIAPDGGNSYEGVFDGNDLTVGNLTIESGNDFIGLFGNINSHAEVKNFGVVNADVNAIGDNVGGLAGYVGNYNIITNCYATGIVSGNKYVGGLIGNCEWGTNVINCYSTSSVSGVIDNIGGFCGTNFGLVYNSYSTGSILNNDNSNGIGGFCGENYGSIYECYALGDVLAGDNSYNIGGFCGINSSTCTIRNCYATGAISGGDNSYNIGGLCGYNFYGSVVNCYSVGAVSGGIGSYNLADFCGYQSTSYSSMNDSFWNSDIGTIGIGYNLDSSSSGTVTNVVGKTTAEMMTQSTFTDWDFDPNDSDAADWMMLRDGEDYPRLAWQQIYTGDITGLYGVDLIDFSYLANYWGMDDCNGLDDCGRADIDDSGNVGIGDLVNVADDWLKE